jgi:phosphate starvation-inducible PhoH-like protein
LNDALTRLKHIEGVGVIHLTKADIVRHRLVQEIVRAYEDEPR